MPSSRFYSLTMGFLIVGLGYLSYQILKPFLSPIVWAVVLSIVFYPLYVFVLRFLKLKVMASLVTLIIILAIILGPFSYLSFMLATELKHQSDYLQSGKPEAMISALRHPQVKWLVDEATTLLGYTENELNAIIVDNMSRLGKELVGRVSSGIGDVVTGILNVVFMAFAIFFFFRDGPEFLRRAHEYMPFSEVQKVKLEVQIRDIIISTIYGGVAVAILEGIMGGITFYLLDIQAPVLWGFAISIASFIPLLGSFAVWGPATVYLFVKGELLKSLILAIVGIFGISFIDTILKPIIIGNRTKMPILVIFFSVLGGIKLFGLIGLVMGPLVLAIFVSVIEIFRSIEGGNNA
ncbi:MAG: AI-2E family transporter [Dissulfurispiraceae bacterium]